MTTLYVVTSRCSDIDDEDDRHVERIFSTREKAEGWIGPAVGTYCVDERTLDDPGAERPMLVHDARIHADTGRDHIYMKGHGVRLMPIGFEADCGLAGVNTPGGRIVWARSTASLEHARELVKRKRAEWLASFDVAHTFTSSAGEMMTIGPAAG